MKFNYASLNNEEYEMYSLVPKITEHYENECEIQGDVFCSTYNECIPKDLYDLECHDEPQRFKNHLKNIFELNEVTLDNDTYINLKSKFPDLEKAYISASSGSGSNITKYNHNLIIDPESNEPELYFEGEYNSTTQELKILNTDRDLVTTLYKEDFEKEEQTNEGQTIINIDSSSSDTIIYLKFEGKLPGFEGDIVLALSVDDNQEPELGKYRGKTYKEYILESAKLYYGNNVISNKSTEPSIIEYPFVFGSSFIQFISIEFEVGRYDVNFNGKQLKFKENTINVTDKLLNVSINDFNGFSTLNDLKLVDILSNRPVKIESGYYRENSEGDYKNKETPKFKINDTEYDNIYIQQTGDLNLEKQNKEFVIYIIFEGKKFYVLASKNNLDEIINGKISGVNLTENIKDATIFNVMLTSLINPRFEIPEQGLIFKIKDNDNYLTIHSGSNDLNIIGKAVLGDPQRNNEWITFISDKLSYEADSKNEVKEEQTKEEQTNEVKEEQTKEEQTNEVKEEQTNEVKEEQINEVKEEQTNEGQTNEGQTNEGQTNEGQTNEGQINEGQTNEGQTNEGQTNEGQTNEGQTNEVSTTNEQSQENSVTNLETTEEEVTKKAGGVSIILILILIILAILYYILKVRK